MDYTYLGSIALVFIVLAVIVRAIRKEREDAVRATTPRSGGGKPEQDDAA